MSAQPQIVGRDPAQQPDLIDRIAQALPEELRGDCYRELSHCRTLPENDEMLGILRAMQFLMVLVEQAPGRIAAEREQMAQVLGRAMKSLEAAHQANVAYHKQLEARLAKLPEEIAKGISADAIAAKLTESLRQQFHQTGLPGPADAMTVQASGLRQPSKQLSAALDQSSHPNTGAVQRVQETLSWMKADLRTRLTTSARRWKESAKSYGAPSRCCALERWASDSLWAFCITAGSARPSNRRGRLRPPSRVLPNHPVRRRSPAREDTPRRSSGRAFNAPAPMVAQRSVGNRVV